MKFIKFKIILIFLVITSCNTKSQYYGKYINDYDKDVTNYLIVNEDNTYEHYYKKGTITLSQKGKWEISDEPYDRIDLYNFCNYNEAGINFKKFAIYFFVKDENYLNPSFDGMERLSFKKK